jgi:Mor family transcriptional regulator
MKTKLKKEHLSGIYEEMAELLGIEITLKVYNHYKGLQVIFPSRLLKKDFVVECLKEEYDGTNLKLLARKYNYSERWMRNLINKNSSGSKKALEDENEIKRDTKK